MPSPIKQHRIHLPSVTPGTCDECPLLGFIPKEQCKYNSKYIRICLQSYERISNRGAHQKRGDYCGFDKGNIKAGAVFITPEKVAELFGLYQPPVQQTINFDNKKK